MAKRGRPFTLYNHLMTCSDCRNPEKKVIAKGLCQACYRKMQYRTNPDYKRKKQENARRYYRKNRERIIERIQENKRSLSKKVTSNKPMPNADNIIEMQNIMFNMGRKWKDDNI